MASTSGTVSPLAGQGENPAEKQSAEQCAPRRSYGGDGGSRTPVQRARPQTSTGLAPRLISPAVARVAERLLGQPDVLADSAQASATGAPDL